MTFEEDLANLTDGNFALQILIALIIFIFSLILGKILGRLIDKFCTKISLNQVFYDITKIKLNLNRILSSIVSYTIYFIGFVWSLNYMGIASTILNFISGFTLILVLILAFLSFKDFIPNLVSGFFIHSKGYLKEGDVIKLHDIEGKIIFLNLVETKVKTKEGDLIFIPNSRLTKYEVIKRKKSSVKK